MVLMMLLRLVSKYFGIVNTVGRVSSTLFDIFASKNDLIMSMFRRWGGQLLKTLKKEPNLMLGK